MSALIALSIGLIRMVSGRGMHSMRAQDFSAWLSAIAGMSAEQRREALQALTKADEKVAASEKGFGWQRRQARPARGRAWSDER